MKEYCSKCGAKLVRVGREGAESWSPMIAMGLYRYDAYDPKTGRRNLVEVYECPKRRWWNSHTRTGMLVETKKSK